MENEDNLNNIIRYLVQSRASGFSRESGDAQGDSAIRPFSNSLDSVRRILDFRNTGIIRDYDNLRSAFYASRNIAGVLSNLDDLSSAIGEHSGSYERLYRRAVQLDSDIRENDRVGNIGNPDNSPSGAATFFAFAAAIALGVTVGVIVGRSVDSSSHVSSGGSNSDSSDYTELFRVFGRYAFSFSRKN